MKKSNLDEVATSKENSKIRAEIWSDFVNWEGRRKGENGFLELILKNYGCRKILDVAIGDGVDTVHLLQSGFEVESNEVDEAFRQKAIQNAARTGLNINPTNLDWRDLSRGYDESAFDAIICMGNSFTCLFGTENQLKALRQFHRILKTGGVLIIDERNYQKILNNPKAALKGEFHSTGEYLYTGTNKVTVNFIDITNESIIIEYIHKSAGKKAWYKVYPFKRNELATLIKRAGFSMIKKFSD